MHAISTRLMGVVAVAVAAAVSAAAVNAATITTSTSAPTPGAGQSVIASNVPTTGVSTSSGTLNYYLNNYGGVPGGTFTTGSTAMNLDSLSVEIQDQGNAAGQNGHFDISVADPATNTYTGLVQRTGSIPTLTAGNYMTFNLSTPLALAPNTTYLYGIYDDNANYAGPGLVTTGGTATQQLATQDGGFGAGTANPNTSGSYDTYTGASGNGGGTATAFTDTSGTDSPVFEVIGSPIAVPEPATLAIGGLCAAGMVLRRRRRTA